MERPSWIQHILSVLPAVGGNWELVSSSKKWTVVAKEENVDINRGELSLDDVLDLLDHVPWHVSDVLGLIVRILRANDEPQDVRWLFSVYVAEAATLLAGSSRDPINHQHFALLRWVRWFLLSEPFRRSSKQIARQADTAFKSKTEFRLHTLDARDLWAEVVLSYDDWPILMRPGIDIEKEGRRLVFVEAGGSELLNLAERDGSGDESYQRFVTWFAREFFTRRFMLRDLWWSVMDRPKLLAAGLLLAAVLVSFAIGVGWEWRALELESVVLTLTVPIWMVLLGLLLFLFAVLLVWGGEERLGFPFLLRFAASSSIGLAVVVTARATWIEKLAPTGSLPAGCQVEGASSAFFPLLLVVGLAAAGLGYLLIEARLHGVPNKAVLGRAFGVWIIGLSWAVIISAIDISLFGPLFTECFPTTLNGWSRTAAFCITAFSVLDIGVFLQVLWEDRPVTYPLGALRFSGHR